MRRSRGYRPAIEPPPTFPFLESQCQRADSSANFHSARTLQPSARSVLRPAWAGYIGGHVCPVKPVFRPLCAFSKPRFFKLFRGPCGSSFARFRSPHMGARRAAFKGFCWRFVEVACVAGPSPSGTKWGLLRLRSTRFAPALLPLPKDLLRVHPITSSASPPGCCVGGAKSRFEQRAKSLVTAASAPRAPAGWSADRAFPPAASRPRQADTACRGSRCSGH